MSEEQQGRVVLFVNEGGIEQGLLQRAIEKCLPSVLVVALASVEEAVDWLRSLAPDLTLSVLVASLGHDVQGFKRLVESARTGERDIVPIVALVPDDLDSGSGEFAMNGANAVIGAPPELDELCRTLSDMFEFWTKHNLVRGSAKRRYGF